ncbi:MAG: RNA 2'-phosphotransferase [Candidatus Eisenbacteria bacterium]|uniref:Probable RNA 2'-phosphotransferase n=1 Tax=Eiseniibacteriota bacterium TaxID=2212470 RepID=A0A7Y2E847_UNCEI|nr:RNA 2'-phosphotransferase [Candidatus Eisenbacteria bacterium]
MPHRTDSDASAHQDESDRNAARLSKFLALVLRHRAFQFDLRLDDEGFVPVDELLEVIHEQGLDWVTEDDLAQVGSDHVRKRFEIVDGKIRATYGHSFRKPIRYTEIDPPEFLFAGMAKNKSTLARSNGLKPDGRQYVHLTDTHEEAMAVGSRADQEGDVVVVLAKQAAEAGIPFHKPTSGLFLSPAIPSKFIEVKMEFGRRARRKGRRR